MAGQILGATYYPSCVVNLQLRFDTQFIRGTEDPAAVTVDTLAANPATTPTAPNGGLLIFDNAGPSDASHLLARIPKKCSVELPAYRQAGKFRMTFDYRDLPIDPRLMRAAGVKIYMDSVQADDFAKSIPQVNPVGGRTSAIQPTSRLSMLKASPDNLVMQGLVDSWHVSHTNSGSEVTIEGRDLVGMFLNTPVTAFAISQIALERRIDDVIRDLIAPMQGWAAGMQVLASPREEWPDKQVPIVGQDITKQVATPRVRQAVRTKGVRLSTGADPDKLNFWDVITRWCYYVGGVPYITMMPDAQYSAPAGSTASPPYKTTLMIRPANSLYTQWYAGDEGSPMKPPFKDGKRRQVGDVSYAVRRMMFGRNISDLSFERKFTGHNLPKVVTVVAYDPSSNVRGVRTTEVSYPPDVIAKAVADNVQLAQNAAKAKKSRVAPSGEIAAQDVIRIPVKGITNTLILESLAKQIYNEIGRGEMGGSCQTKSLSSFGAGNEDPDLVRLRPGDGMTLVVDQRPLEARAPNVSPLTAQYQQNREQMAADLERRLGDKNLAQAIAISLTNAITTELSTYRVSNVKFDWDIASGIAIAFDFHNFIAAVADVTPTPITPAPSPTPGAATAVQAPKK